MTRPSTLSGAVAAAALLVGITAGLVPHASGGYLAKITNSTDTVASAPYFTCAASTAADRAAALFQLPLTESAGSTTAADVSGNSSPGTYQGTMATTTSPAACSRDGGTAYLLNGTSSYISTSVKQTDPTTFTLEVWFRTTTASGKLMGFGSSQTGSSGSYDRHLYITAAGLLTFGIYNSATYTVTSTTAVTDGAWHQAIATLAPAGTANPGMTLYLDGKQVAQNTANTTPQNFSGWWRVGYDNQSGWPGVGSDAYFTGSMRYASVYTTAFTATQVANHYASGR